MRKAICREQQVESGACKPVECVLLQAVVPIWVLALYHFFAYAAAHFGGSALWQRYGALAHSMLSALQVSILPDQAACCPAPCPQHLHVQVHATWCRHAMGHLQE